jgi:hypothetical protein
LGDWESFYVIVGSSAGALTGLQFVVIALVAESRARSSSREIDAFGTPTVVHFCAVLLVSAILSAPWHGLGGPRLVLVACAVAGVIYTVIVVRRTLRQTGYKPVLEDWTWHAAIPLAAYAALAAAGLVLKSHPESALFVIGTAAVLLLFTGIHNAWDAVTFLTLVRIQPQHHSAAEASAGEPRHPAP